MKFAAPLASDARSRIGFAKNRVMAATKLASGAPSYPPRRGSAIDRAHLTLAPGMVLVADLIRLAILTGRDTFDLLKGDLEYKYRFGSTPRPVGRLVLER